jgi:hypothetical protein
MDGPRITTITNLQVESAPYQTLVRRDSFGARINGEESGASGKRKYEEFFWEPRSSSRTKCQTNRYYWNPSDRSQFAICTPPHCRQICHQTDSRIMGIFNALHPYPYCDAFLLHWLPAAAGKQSVDGTQFIAAESHRIPVRWALKSPKAKGRVFRLMRGYIREWKETKTPAGPLLLQ